MAGSIGSVSVDVVPDASGFVEKLKAKLRDITVDVRADLDASKAKAELDKLAASRRSVTIKADADTKLAAAKLDRLSKNRTAKIRAAVDRSSFSQATSASRGAARGMGALTTAAIALSPALIPATAAVVGLAGALAAPALAGAGALGIFGVVSIAAIAKAKNDLKAIQKLQVGAATQTNPQKAKEMLKQANDLQKSLPKSEQQLFASVGRIQNAFDSFLKKTGPQTFGLFSKVVDLGTKALPKLAPLVTAVGASLTRTVMDLTHWVGSNGFTGFINYLRGPGLHAFELFEHIIGNVTVGVAGLVRAFTPIGTSVYQALARATAKFAEFGKHANTNKGFQNFLAYVRQVGPEVGHTLADIGAAFIHIGRALAPQGVVLLKIADDLANLVRRAKPGQLALIAGGIGAIGLATGKIGKLGGLSLIITSLAYADKHSHVFHVLAQGAEAFAKALGPLGVLAAGGALLSTRLKLPSIGKPGGAVNKVLGGGVQKVFVVNMGEGGLGLGGKGGKGLPGGTPVVAGGLSKTGQIIGIAVIGAISHALGKVVSDFRDKHDPSRLQQAGLRSNLQTIGQGGASGGSFKRTFGSFDSGFSTRFQKMAADATVGRSKLGGVVGALSGGNDQWNAAQKNIERVDSALVSLNKRDPSAGLQAYKTLLHESGLSAGQFAKQLPHATKSVDEIRKALSKPPSLKFGHSAALNFSQLRFEANKAGISTRSLGKMMRSLPQAVRTLIATPGSLQSKASIKALQRQYGLTPKQIHTIITLLGARDAQANIKQTQRGLQHLAATNPKPHVELQGASQVNGTINGIRGNLNSLDGNSATIYLHHVTTQQIVRLPSLGKPRVGPPGATGGMFNDGRAHLVGEFGPELIQPAGPSFVHTAAATRDLANNSRDSGSGSSVFHLYDVNNVLLGAIRGVADDRIKARGAHARTLARQ